MIQVLYLSYDGLTDPLGQSQILPYLEGLSTKDYSFTVISFEKAEAFNRRSRLIEKRCRESKIDWHPLRYTKKPPVFSTVYDLRRMEAAAKRIIGKRQIDLIHVRSYVPALVALKLKKERGLPFIFDKRGFWIEERIEGRIWNPNNPVMASVIRFFKKKETQFFHEAKAVVSLTHAAREALLEGRVINLNIAQEELMGEKTFVIPCAADKEIFSYVSPEERSEAKRNLNLPANDPVFVYLGSIGTWYMLKEILEVYGALRKELPNLWFYIITSGEEKTIRDLAGDLQIPLERIKVEFVNREELRLRLSIADFSINFMRPGYSRLATSPVKIGELLSMGIPFIVNAGIGDSEKQISDLNAGLVTKAFPDQETFAKIRTDYPKLLEADRKEIALQASEIFSLKKAIESYEKVYEYALRK